MKMNSLVKHLRKEAGYLFDSKVRDLTFGIDGDGDMRDFLIGLLTNTMDRKFEFDPDNPNHGEYSIKGEHDAGREIQCFDFGYVSNDQIIEESASACDALYEGFLRLPAPLCAFQHSWTQDDVTSVSTLPRAFRDHGVTEAQWARHVEENHVVGEVMTSLYLFMQTDMSIDSPILATEFLFRENRWGWNAMWLELDVWSQEAQVDWGLKRTYRTKAVRNPHGWDVNPNNVFDPMVALLGRLNAQGMERERIEPSEKQNKARARRGLTPMVGHTVVKIAPYRAPLGHSGPRDEVSRRRYHFRRGHVRRFENGGKTWVRPCFVGCPEDGRVEHTYQVERAA